MYFCGKIGSCGRYRFNVRDITISVKNDFREIESIYRGYKNGVVIKMGDLAMREES